MREHDFLVSKKNVIVISDTVEKSLRSSYTSNEGVDLEDETPKSDNLDPDRSNWGNFVRSLSFGRSPFGVDG